jgi:hypothetical protein
VVYVFSKWKVFFIVTIKLPPYRSLCIFFCVCFPFEVYLFLWTTWMCDWYWESFLIKLIIFTVKVWLLESRMGHRACCATGPLCYSYYNFSLCVLFRNSNFFILVSPLLSLRCYVPIIRQRMNIIYRHKLCHINFYCAWNNVGRFRPFHRPRRPLERGEL